MKSRISTALILATMSTTAFGGSRLFCTSQTNRTWFAVSGDQFTVVQDSGNVLRFGKTTWGCQESYPATCIFQTSRGDLATISIGDKATGTINYIKGNQLIETAVTCIQDIY